MCCLGHDNELRTLKTMPPPWVGGNWFELSKICVVYLWLRLISILDNNIKSLSLVPVICSPRSTPGTEWEGRETLDNLSWPTGLSLPRRHPSSLTKSAVFLSFLWGRGYQLYVDKGMVAILFFVVSLSLCVECWNF